jgi:hypothetical protein
MVNNFLKVILFIAIYIFMNCADTNIATNDEKKSVIAAYILKSSECGNAPGLIPVALNASTKFGVNVCIMTIINSKCPFSNLPIECLEMYKLDVPNVGPRLPKNFL